MIIRSKGIVIGRDDRAGSRLGWRVRVQNERDPRNDMELPVASTHDDIILAEGLCVDFIVGTFEGEEEIYKAIDVHPIELPLIPQGAVEQGQKEHSVLWSVVEQVNRELGRQIVEWDSLPGQGGQRHRYLQHLIKRMGEDKGYRATIEKQIPGSGESIDVTLEREGMMIACEISITNIYGELENIRKCLKAGYHYVISLSTDRGILNQIRRQVSGRVSEDDMQRIRFFLPEELLSFLEQLESQLSSSESTCRGYRVRVQHVPVSPEEASAKREAVGKVVLDATRRKRREQEKKEGSPARSSNT